ncbi:hypothetical protein L1887_43911 [Cichorium endivia]|nr:hypothetical protein L1887_43911 [Cichorium endivia]
MRMTVRRYRRRRTGSDALGFTRSPFAPPFFDRLEFLSQSISQPRKTDAPSLSCARTSAERRCAPAQPAGYPPSAGYRERLVLAQRMAHPAGAFPGQDIASDCPYAESPL